MCHVSEEGDYSFPALLPGEYEVSAEAEGFRRIVQRGDRGSWHDHDDRLCTGSSVKRMTAVTVEGASPQLRYDSHTVGGVVTQRQIQDLPLNGRNFLELAKLEPGVQPPTRASSNRIFVPALGQPAG